MTDSKVLSLFTCRYKVYDLGRYLESEAIRSAYAIVSNIDKFKWHLSKSLTPNGKDD